MARRKTDRSGYWRQIVAEQERSGLPVRSFCEQAGVGEHSFYIWRARLRQERCVEFALVEPAALSGARASSPELELTLANGDQLRIPSGADAATVRMVLAALRG